MRKAMMMATLNTPKTGCGNKSRMPEVSGCIVYILKQTPAGIRVLFLRRSGGQFVGSWWPVAGTPKPDETPEETARRELFEETGLNPDSWHEFGIDIPNADGVRVLKAYVVWVDDTHAIKLNYEHDAYRWMTADEAVNSVPEGSRHYLEHLAANFMVEP